MGPSIHFKGKNLCEICIKTSKWRVEETASYRSLVLGKVGIWMVFKARYLAKIRSKQNQREEVED